MISYEDWLGFAIKKGLLKKIDQKNKECGCSLFIKNEYYSDVDLFDKKFISIQKNLDWILYGTRNGWIDSSNEFPFFKMECVVHDNPNNNFMFTPEKSFKFKKSKDIFNIQEEGIYNEHFFNFQLSNLDHLSFIVKNLFLSDISENFIDIGCGNGLTLKTVHELNLYKRIEGIDVSNKLISECKRMSKNFNVQNISAEYYILPDKKYHIYMCNPFSNVILEKFLNNNIENIIKNKSKIIFNVPIRAHHLIVNFGLNFIRYEKENINIYSV